MMELKRTEDEMSEVMNECQNQVNDGISRFFGMSYEDGVVAALQWAVGETDDHPYPPR